MTVVGSQRGKYLDIAHMHRDYVDLLHVWLRWRAVALGFVINLGVGKQAHRL